MNDVELLRATPLFAGLTDAQFEAVSRVVRRQKVPMGKAILREGERTDSVFILGSGTVEVTKRFGFAAEDATSERKQKTLIRLTAPQFFGEMGLLEQSERSATITARSACELLEITRADFEGLADSDFSLGYYVVRNIAIVLASRLRRTDRDVLNLTIALSLSLGNA